MFRYVGPVHLCVFLWNTPAAVSRNMTPKGGEQTCRAQQSQPSNFSLNMFFVLALCHRGVLCWVKLDGWISQRSHMGNIQPSSIMH